MNEQNLQTAYSTSINAKALKKIVENLFQNLKSPFDRPNATQTRLRKEQLLMKIKLWPGSSTFISTFHKCPNSQNFQNINLPQSSSHIPKFLQKNILRSPRWLFHEDMAMIKTLLYLQELPCNLSVVYPGHIPNWHFVAKQVNTYSTFPRSETVCKYHYESIISANNNRHLAKTEPQSHSEKQSKPSKKSKNQPLMSQQKQNGSTLMSNLSISPQSRTHNSIASVNVAGLENVNKSLRNSSMANAIQSIAVSQITKALNSAIFDNNAEFTQEMNNRFDAINRIVISRTHTQSRFMNQKHQHQEKCDHRTKLMTIFNINFDHLVSVEELAFRRAERIFTAN